MIDIVIILVLLCIVGASAFYVYRAKKKGGCIGCPYAKHCSKTSCDLTDGHNQD